MLRAGVAAALLACCLPATAAETCPAFFLDGTQPVLSNPKLRGETVPLCFSAFAVLHSGIARTPLYAAQSLTRASVAAARTIDRVDAFRDEDRLPATMRARLDDYVRSGFDRGHLAPAGDMPTGAAQAESFSLANIVPQDRSVNRNLWAGIEEAVRRLATERGTLFVVTGPVFSGATVTSINGRVLVPTDLFKAVYDPRRREGAAYLVPNRADGEWRQVPLVELAALTGVDPFPSLSPTAKAQVMTLPEPRTYDRSRERRGEDPLTAWLERQIERLLRSLWRELMRAIF
ncbi:endonuclease [Methylobacterium sp. Leaf399]|uniref:DNA/RNA non-specific endonuclease n=1 Tax=Methylobacterium sp. Leaf399 TaxID=1736364 RepID=UPI00070083EE|nr:DNA/RNA non-specific endonuclease [Methylobacterium sp. Leaf399]KQT07331.1 endonuclease [Methylobacterium sp. Leaf399]